MTARSVAVSAASSLTAVMALGAGCALDENGAAQETGQTTSPSTSPASPDPTPSLSPTSDPDAPTGWGPTEGELDRAADLVASLDAAEQAAVVLMPGFWGYDGDQPEPAEADLNARMHGHLSISEALEDRPYGGLFLRPEVIGDASQVRSLTTSLHRAGDRPAGLPLLISMDQEGGAVQRLQSGVDTVPSASSVGATGDRGYARQVARDNGESLRDLGVTMVLAPVAGVDPTGTSALGSRTYSADHEEAAAMVVASLRGYLDVGVVPVVKHFPGLGSVEGDSHTSLPVQQKSVRDLRRSDLMPFQSAIEAGVPAVMTAHVAVEALAPRTPSSVSPEVVEGLLREDLGFDGVVITDSHGMAPIHERFGPAEGAVRALAAGNDLVLNSPRPKRAWRAVTEAVADGTLPVERISEAATRVLALRIYQQRLAMEID